jgi:hypothetical protein
MKIVYLDQNHWIELSRAAHGRKTKAETPAVLGALRKARKSGCACFPLSFAHYVETHKQRALARRTRLADLMLELSDRITIAPPHVVARHEIEKALAHCFPGRVEPQPFQLLGTGLTHAADHDFDLPIEWPPEASQVPTDKLQALQKLILTMAEHSLLSGLFPTKDSAELGALTDLQPERSFKARVEKWQKEASRYSAVELERSIYANTLNDIKGYLCEVLSRYRIPAEDLASLGETGWRTFLDEMPSRRADMHLQLQFAKNQSLRPKDSDLADWAYLGVAVSYCDILVTEKQIADLFSRGFETHATVVSELRALAELVPCSSAYNRNSLSWPSNPRVHPPGAKPKSAPDR